LGNYPDEKTGAVRRRRISVEIVGNTAVTRTQIGSFWIKGIGKFNGFFVFSATSLTLTPLLRVDGSCRLEQCNPDGKDEINVSARERFAKRSNVAIDVRTTSKNGGYALI